MRRISTTKHFLLSFALVLSTLSAQSDADYLRLDVNKLALSVSALGEIGSDNGLVAEWPYASGHEYLNRLMPVVIRNGGTAELLSWVSLESGGIYGLFASDSPSAWPTSFSGQWQGYGGPDSISADLETIARLRNTDTGLEMILRFWQWHHFILQDMVFMSVEIINPGTADVDQLKFAILADVNVGGDGTADIISFDDNTLMAEDPDGIGRGSGLSAGIGTWDNPGIFGLKMLNGDIAAWHPVDPALVQSRDAQAIANHLNGGLTSGLQTASAFIAGTEYQTVAAGDTLIFTLALTLSQTHLDLAANHQAAEMVHNNGYTFQKSFHQPVLNAVAQSGKVILYWDAAAENKAGFEGYKIYKSTDPGFNDSYQVTNDRGVLVYHKTEAVYDLDNGSEEFFPDHYDGFRYYIGNNSGLKHVWTDTDVNNGQTYFYAVTAFDAGDPESMRYPSESTRRVSIDPVGTITTTVNTAVARPLSESAGFIPETTNFTKTAGFGTGALEVEVVDRYLLRDDASYQISFDDTTSEFTVYNIDDITDPQNPMRLFTGVDAFSTADLRSENTPFVDGMRFFVYDAELDWNSDSTRWLSGDSNWEIVLARNTNLPGEELFVPMDYEVRFAGPNADTVLFFGDAILENPVPFTVWNVTDPTNTYQENILIADANNSNTWESDELIYIVSGSTLDDLFPVFWTIILSEPAEGSPIAPESGDVALLVTDKPFSSNDAYTINTTGIGNVGQITSQVLDQVAVVPNPYVLSSRFESKSMYTGGAAERRLQFINLPMKCTIRIFNIRGKLLHTIVHNNPTQDGTVFWDLKASDNETVAYGVYLFHIDAPGIGEKVGRFAIIR
jgi:hypothetical protein